MTSEITAVETTNSAETNPRTTVHRRLKEASEEYSVPKRCHIYLAPADDPYNSPKRPSPQTGYDRIAFDSIDDANYGICPDGGLVIIDDDGGSGPDIPPTFSTNSPHNAGHRYVVSDPYVAEAIKCAFGAENPTFEWGELKAGNTKNTHVVGPGSVLERCDKDYHDCSQSGEGAYTIAEDLPIIYIPTGELIQLLDEAAPNRNATVPADGFQDDGRPVGITVGGEPSDGPHTSVSGPLSEADKQLVETAKTAKNGDKFARLWAGNTTGYQSHSEADLALCNFLAFYTRKEADRMARMFRHSGLMRDKWKRDDYRQLTVAEAIEGTNGVYDPKTESHQPGFRPETSNITRDKVLRAIVDLRIATSRQIADHEDVDRSIDQVRRALNAYEEYGAIAWKRDGRNTYYYLPGTNKWGDRLDQLGLEPSDFDTTDDTKTVERI